MGTNDRPIEYCDDHGTAANKISCTGFGSGRYEHDYGTAWPIIQFAVLLIAHGTAGAVSWVSDYRTWSDRLMAMVAVHLHCVTYALNWPVYQGLTATTETTRDILPLLAALGMIIGPSILMFGGPIAAIVNPRQRRTEEA